MYDEHKIQECRTAYPAGTRVRLISMEGEPQMKPGLIGTVTCVDDLPQIHVNWENGSTLALVPEVDKFEKIA